MSENLTKEESLELAYELTHKYSELSVKEAEYMDIKTKLDELPDHSKDLKYSSFRFFWPYLIVASVAEAVICTFACIWIMTAGSDLFFNLFYFVLMIITWPAIVIFGAIKAKKRRNDLNEGMEMKARNDQRLKLEYETELKKKERELVRMEEELEEPNEIVPPTMRNRDCMETVRRMLETGSAESFKEAIDRLKPVGHNRFY